MTTTNTDTNFDCSRALYAFVYDVLLDAQQTLSGALQAVAEGDTCAKAHTDTLMGEASFWQAAMHAVLHDPDPLDGFHRILAEECSTDAPRWHLVRRGSGIAETVAASLRQQGDVCDQCGECCGSLGGSDEGKPRQKTAYHMLAHAYCNSPNYSVEEKIISAARTYLSVNPEWFHDWQQHPSPAGGLFAASNAAASVGDFIAFNALRSAAHVASDKPDWFGGDE